MITNKFTRIYLSAKAENFPSMREIAFSPIKHARDKLGMTQVEFAKMLGVSKRTLEGWEQGTKKPSGAAISLIRLAVARPEVVREVLAA